MVNKVEKSTGVIWFEMKTNNQKTGTYHLNPVINGNGFLQKNSKEDEQLSFEIRKAVQNEINLLNLESNERAICKLKFNTECYFSFVTEKLHSSKNGYCLEEQKLFLPINETEIRYFFNSINRAISLIGL